MVSKSQLKGGEGCSTSLVLLMSPTADGKNPLVLGRLLIFTTQRDLIYSIIQKHGLSLLLLLMKLFDLHEDFIIRPWETDA